MAEKDKRTDKSQQLKKAMLTALEQSRGIVSIAAEKAGINRGTHYDWYKDDEEYRKAADALNDVVLDFAEDRLYRLVEGGDTTATIFLLKTRGKRRGYIEKQEMGITDKEGNDILKPDLSKLTKEELKVMASIEKKLYGK